jgi:hypothetical protein
MRDLFGYLDREERLVEERLVAGRFRFWRGDPTIHVLPRPTKYCIVTTSDLEAIS